LVGVKTVELKPFVLPEQHTYCLSASSLTTAIIYHTCVLFFEILFLIYISYKD